MGRFERNIPDDLFCECEVCDCEDANECEDNECKCCSRNCYGIAVVADDTVVNRAS